MKSPKFEFKKDEISSALSITSLRNSYQKKVKSQIRDQLFVDLIEFRDVALDLNRYLTEINDEVLSGFYQPFLPVHYLIEKSRGLCRQMTLAHPRDLIVLQCLTTALHPDISARAPSKNAFFEPGKSPSMFGKSKYLASQYGGVASWLRFQKHILNFSRSRKFVVVTDVANFYDFINFSHMRNIISDICAVSESVLDFLLYILQRLSWTPDYMPRVDVGLPQMEVEAPRVLANAMLFELDRFSEIKVPGDYARFMDDIDFGVDTIREAKETVRDIDLVLQSRQLRLNSSKTKILPVDTGEADRHFCAKENHFLDYCGEVLDRFRGKVGYNPAHSALKRAHIVWRGNRTELPFTGERYFFGNGDKIFKRIGGMLLACGGNMPEDDLLWIIKNHPSMRSYAFYMLSFYKNRNVNVYQLIRMVLSGVFVDDSAVMNFAQYLVHSKFIRNGRLDREIRDVVDFLFSKQQGIFWFYATLIIASKFFDQKELLQYLDKSKSVWGGDYWAGRLIGGLQPRFPPSTTERDHFFLLINHFNNKGVEEVTNYHYRLETAPRPQKLVYEYLKHKNKSFPQEIYHPKALIALSFSYNTHALPLMAGLLKTHTSFLTDPYYKKWF